MTAGLLRAWGIAMAVGLAVLLPAGLLTLLSPLRKHYTAALRSAVCTGLALLAVGLPLLLLAAGPVTVEVPAVFQSTPVPTELALTLPDTVTEDVPPLVPAPEALPQAPAPKPELQQAVWHAAQLLRRALESSAVTALAWVWLAGAALLGALRLAHWLYWRRQCARWAQPVPAHQRQLFARAAAAQGLADCALPRLVYTAWVDIPMLTGLRRPTLLLPTKEYDDDTLTLALCHELQHLRRWDVARQLLYTAAELLHWCDPLVYLLTGAGRRAAEQACDAGVLHSPALSLCGSTPLPEAYAMALLTAAAAARQKSPAVGLLGRTRRGKRQKRELEDRMKLLFDTAPRKNGRAAAALLLTAALAAGLLAGCAANAQTVETVIAPESESLVTAPTTPEETPVEETPVEETAAEETPAEPEADCAPEAAQEEKGTVIPMPDTGHGDLAASYTVPAEYADEDYTVTGVWLWPVPGADTISCGYGENHDGMDIAAPTGTPIQAIGKGIVMTARENTTGLGNYVILWHQGSNKLSLYAHCAELLVQNGDPVKAGDVIATVGNTGNSTGPHCHLSVYTFTAGAEEAELIDPRPLFGKDPDYGTADQG